MTTLKNQTYYERLEIAPSAGPFEICEAYRDAMNLYSNQSQASYSFFTKKERQDILRQLEEAFATLVDAKARAKYDEHLIIIGCLSEEQRYQKDSKSPAQISVPVQKQTISSSTAVVADVQKIMDLQGILHQEVISGDDLRQIRSELDISLEHIAAKIKVRPVLLQYIEADQFDKLPSRLHLKSYLLQYLQCLQIDAPAVAERYLKRIKYF